MEILSGIAVPGLNVVDENTRERNGKEPEISTLATIRDIEKGLEANLQECMNFLQVLTEDNSRKEIAAEWANRDERQFPELEVFHAMRPNTAPPKSATHLQEHLVFVRGVSCEFDCSTVESESSCDSNKHLFQTVSKIDLEGDNVPLRNKTAQQVHPHHDCYAVKTLPSNLLLVDERIRTLSTEPITEIPSPKLADSSTGNQNGKVSVCVRMRPFNEHEKVCPLKQVLCSQKNKVVVKDYNYLRQGNPMNKSKVESQFDVDNALDDSFLPRGNRQRKEESQRCMFEILGRPCVENSLDGFNTTIMTYGQMGSGKTYTIVGDGTTCGRGLVPRIVNELMRRVQDDQSSGVHLTIQVSYLEIYQEKVRDLLVDKKAEHTAEESGVNCSLRCTELPLIDGGGSSFFLHGQVKDQLRVREHPETGTYVESPRWKVVTAHEEMDKLLKLGAANRMLGSTISHARLSSRGHTLFTIKITKTNEKSQHTSVSHINMVDLAGSEKMALGQKPSAERTYESKYINRSLAQLNDMFTNLPNGRSNGKFVSYRSSALTMLLRESLSENSKTYLVANISPAEQDFQESIHTLRCAAKAKRIHAPPNQDPATKKQIFMKMDEEIRVLQYLISDLTKKPTPSKVAEPLRAAKETTDVAEEFRPTGETDCRRSLQEKKLRLPSRQQKGKPSWALNAKDRFVVHTKIT
ncbi:uncharacterized protein [Physcomitrium patens]|uniref:uncharacterized protein isoform X3 n=1 Tax=Physcomitrium patens TaxID=3218 RepID=UPI000D176FBB|nr:kinesin-like protein KIF13B isoform X3 [Physcomitrium patens]|eukprot:XP_024360790.1 kinesin-like protein KIF13B isoform X3 [Physcomitrella patens]